MVPTVKDEQMAAEQSRVDEAYARLEEMRAAARRMLEEGYRQAQAGTKGSLVDRDAMVHQAAVRSHALDVAEEGLVFGRLDLVGGETLYVGRIGVRTGEHDSLVIDWRAPAAEAFYRATPEDPRGVVRRRVLHCRGRTVVDLEDDLLIPGARTDLTIVGDGAFLASLARSREGTMRDIVATIQREQDEVIRSPADGTVIVQGGPGTGKTAVALHRVAYLLFRHRRRFGSRGVLILGPNPRFTAYIERVLPSLGEGGATLRSLGDLVPGAEATAHDVPELARVKGATMMTRVLRRAVQDAPPGSPDTLRTVYRGVVVSLEREALDRIRREVHRTAHGSVNTAYPRAADLLLGALWDRFLEVGGPDDAPGTSRAAFTAHVRDERRFVEFLRSWWPVRRPADVLRSLTDPDRLRRAAGRSLNDRQLRLLAESWGGPWSYLDIALLDEAGAILGPPPRPPRGRRRKAEDPFVIDGVNVFTGERVETEDDDEPTLRELTTYVERREQAMRRDDEEDEDLPVEYAHIVVDEAQDLSPMQWRMLGRRGRTATWTIVADPAQSAWEDAAAARKAMDTALGRRPRHAFELTTNYRNSVEIAEVAARVLARAVPEARPARAVRASGHRPVIRHVPALDGNVRAEAAALADAVEGTVGVILPVGHPAPCLPDLPERVQVLDALEAKGLEFDAALIVEPGEIADYAQTGLRTLYVAVSRATQRLTVLTTAPDWEALLSGTAPDNGITGSAARGSTPGGGTRPGGTAGDDARPGGTAGGDAGSDSAIGGGAGSGGAG
ncbi:HelD family protein [Actinoallomurus soli]|uniref:HelD family protein n=1 Tax=Actinoallomurus soli TaxID=2952535 RepID=UPI0020930403|nr:UvrD-helicase domain-containing protein [Actinoallomurus soli]MCO5969226.1 AAA family ATPase [Actinoallomurus soli]